MPKRIRTRSATKKKGAVEFRMLPFDQWRKRFDSLLTVESPADQALRRCIDAQTANFSRDELRLCVLEILHGLTSIRPSFADHARRANKHFKDSLKEFVQRIETLKGQISGNGILSLPLGVPISTQALVKSLEPAAEQARILLALIDHPYTRRPTIVDQCLPLFVSAYCSTYMPPMSEKELCALARLAMRAHGYDDTELASLDETSGSGTARKHAQAYLSRALAVAGIDKKSDQRGNFLLHLDLALKFSLFWFLPKSPFNPSDFGKKN
jgi:hypothetical protein